MSNSLRPHGRQDTGFPILRISQSLLKFVSIESVMPSSRLVLCHPLLLLPSIFPSIRVFFNELALRIRWPKYWSFSFNVSPSNEYSELISFTTSLSSSFLRPSLVKPSQVSRRNSIVNTINEIMPRIKMKVSLDRPGIPSADGDDGNKNCFLFKNET